LFRGTFEHAIDAKGRTSLPVKFRELLATRWSAGDAPLVMVTRDPLSPCLRLYPMPEWTPVEERLAQKSTFDPRVNALRRVFIGGAQETQVDKLGRMLIAPNLRDFAGLTGKVSFVGSSTYIEIWNQQRLDEWLLEQRQGENLETTARALGELGL
jgi:MraZ protein